VDADSEWRPLAGMNRIIDWFVAQISIEQLVDMLLLRSVLQESKVMFFDFIRSSKLGLLSVHACTHYIIFTAGH
jgi:hypothetical protein